MGPRGWGGAGWGMGNLVLGHGLGLSGTPVIAEIFRGTPGEKMLKNVKNHLKVSKNVNLQFSAVQPVPLRKKCQKIWLVRLCGFGEKFPGDQRH